MMMGGAMDQPSLVANPPRPKGEYNPPSRRESPPAFREERQKPRASLVERLALVFTVPPARVGRSGRTFVPGMGTEKQII